MFSLGKLRAFTALAALSVAFIACDKDDDDGDGTQADDDDDDDGGDDDDDDGDGANECQPGADECEEGFKCQPYTLKESDSGVNAAKCVPLEGDKQHGETCKRTRYSDDCDRDVFCMADASSDLGEGPGFECYGLCDPFGNREASCEDIGAAGTVCNPYNGGVLPWCDIPCNPLRPVACSDGDGCYKFNDGHWCFQSSVEGGGGGQGDACDPFLEQSCLPGFWCNVETPMDVVGCESAACCTAYCEVGGDGTECEAPAVCQAMWGDDAVTWWPEFKDEVGHCVLAGG